MKNFVQEGEIITVIAPSAVASGDGVQVGSIFGVATTGAAQGFPVELKREGVFTLPVLNTDVITAGAKLFWDATNKRLTVTATSNTLVGAASLPKIAGVTVVAALLDGVIR